MIHFTTEQIEKIVKLCEDGHTQRDIAIRMSVSTMTIKGVLNKQCIKTKRSRKYGTSQPPESTEIVTEKRMNFQWAYPDLKEYRLI